MRARLGILALLAATTVGLALAAPAAALKLRPCPGQKGFGCATLRVPLDASGAVPGTIGLRIAVQDTRAARRRPGLLVALSGGPGQGSTAFAASFVAPLKPALGRYRLAVLDQRGTGDSGPLNCPVLQKAGALAPVKASELADCAERIGPRRAFYTTADSVGDLEALRVALRAPELALTGTSYGTYVALQYARAHPATTDRLVLDSVVGPDGIDPYLLDTYRRLPRVLDEQCAKGRCRAITDHPVADVGALARRLDAGGISATVYDASGRRRTARYRGGDVLLNLLIAGDLNPYLQPALPGAIAAALHGDAAPLARLRAIGDGGPTKLRELSAGLNVTTTCADVRLPYPLASPLPDRPAATTAGLDALDPAAYAPFSRETVRATSFAEDCLLWPADVTVQPFTAPLPDVPTLLLSGRLDLRTPLENAKDVAAELPRAQRVTVPGNGHDELDGDVTGCVERALARFMADRRVGSPCAGKSAAVRPFQRPPRSVKGFRSAPGVGGRRGRVLFAVLDTLADARVTGLQRLYAALPTRGGGLRGGHFRLDGLRLRVARYAYIPGVRLTGEVRERDGRLRGRVRVFAGRSGSGTLVLGPRGHVRGTLGGRAVRYTDARGGAAIARAGGAPRLATIVAGLRVDRRRRIAR